MENPIKMDDLGYPFFGNTHIYIHLLPVVKSDGQNFGLRLNVSWAGCVIDENDPCCKLVKCSPT